jgi:hypothetical protein
LKFTNEKFRGVKAASCVSARSGWRADLGGFHVVSGHAVAWVEGKNYFYCISFLLFASKTIKQKMFYGRGTSLFKITDVPGN